jgi:hypothetical protein
MVWVRFPGCSGPSSARTLSPFASGRGTPRGKVGYAVNWAICRLIWDSRGHNYKSVSAKLRDKFPDREGLSVSNLQQYVSDAEDAPAEIVEVILGLAVEPLYERAPKSYASGPTLADDKRVVTSRSMSKELTIATGARESSMTLNRVVSLVALASMMLGCPFDAFMERRLNEAQRVDIEDAKTGCPKGMQARGENCQISETGARICMTFVCEPIK